MDKFQKYLLFFFAFIITLLFQSYTGCAQEIIEKTGTVKYFSFEGGFFGIAGDDGVNYDPINLGETYKKDNLKIKFKGKIRTDMMSTRNWGTIVEISDIEELGAPPLLGGYEIYEWGVMVGCKNDDVYFNTSRPERITYVKQPVIYVHATEKNPFDLKVTFKSGKPTETYPPANTEKNTTEWKNVSFPISEKSMKVDIDTSRLVPLGEIMGTLNKVDADELEYNGIKSRFLFYEGEMHFSNKVTANYDRANREVTITNNFDYAIYNVVYSTFEGNFINPVYLSCIAEIINPGEFIKLKVGTKDIEYWAEDLIKLGFTKMESKSFSQIWSSTFLENSNSNNWTNLIYRIPQSELEKMITLDFNPLPSKVTRVMYVLVHLNEE
jgi:hypothetical protein